MQPHEWHGRLFGLLELPNWTGKLILGLLLLGLPLVLLFSWVYELTPEGLKKQHEVDLHQSITGETGRKINYVIGALAVFAMLVVALDRFIPRAHVSEHAARDPLTSKWL